MSGKDKIVVILIVLGLAFISVGIYAYIYSVPIFSLDWPNPPLLTYPHREKASPLILSGIILIILGVIVQHAGGGKDVG